MPITTRFNYGFCTMLGLSGMILLVAGLKAYWLKDFKEKVSTYDEFKT
jgi:hypothetical protein